MSRRVLTATAPVALIPVVLLLMSAPEAAGGQGAQVSSSADAKSKATTKPWIPPRTPWGHPDLQGVWDYRTITPLERPSALSGKEFLTDDEAAVFEREENRRQNRDLIDPAKGGLQYPPGGVVPYNEFWYDRGKSVVGTRRTSLIVDPPDGRLPPLTPEGKKRADAGAVEERETQLGRPRADSYEDRPLSERCILSAGTVPILPGPYNNNIEIIQTSGYVAILNEMIHEHRIVPLDARPHVSQNIRQWVGDSRGHWEGDTLVVDTTNFSPKVDFRGAGPRLHVVERFRRLAADTLQYEFTVDDPTIWTTPWTAVIPMQKSSELIYEYACHEGNFALKNILAGARALEKRPNR
ncbi:MAG: hypothetical protein DMG16_09055 [Acidobacteria bacterium]|nr:MAG: hypothetical protein DMG16_09055 [Acidobacteriota bacterium]